jgi:hypothetical protein
MVEGPTAIGGGATTAVAGAADACRNAGGD